MDLLGTVCGEGWGDTEAGLVCARLTFPSNMYSELLSYSRLADFILTVTLSDQLHKLTSLEQAQFSQYTVWPAPPHPKGTFPTVHSPLLQTAVTTPWTLE